MSANPVADAVTRKPDKPAKPSRLVADDPDKPPRVVPNTYWTRKGGGWVLEFKKKTKGGWLYEYYGMLKLETWNQLKGRYQDEKLTGIIKGVVLAKRAELQRARGPRSGKHGLRLVSKRA